MVDSMEYYITFIVLLSSIIWKNPLIREICLDMRVQEWMMVCSKCMCIKVVGV